LVESTEKLSFNLFDNSRKEPKKRVKKSVPIYIISDITEWLIAQILEYPFRVCLECSDVTTFMFCDSCTKKKLSGIIKEESGHHLANRLKVSHSVAYKYIRLIRPILVDKRFYIYDFEPAPQEIAEFFTKKGFNPYSIQEFEKFYYSKLKKEDILERISSNLSFDKILAIITWMHTRGKFLSGRFFKQAVKEEIGKELNLDYQIIANWRIRYNYTFFGNKLFDPFEIATYLLKNKTEFPYLDYL